MAKLTTGKDKELRSKEDSPRPHSVVTEDEWYDLLPVEKKLIGYSLTLGIALLVVFTFAFRVLK